MLENTLFHRNGRKLLSALCVTRGDCTQKRGCSCKSLVCSCASAAASEAHNEGPALGPGLSSVSTKTMSSVGSCMSWVRVVLLDVKEIKVTVENLSQPFKCWLQAFSGKCFLLGFYGSRQWAAEVPVLSDLFVYLQEESCAPLVLNVTIEARVQWMLSEKPHMDAL